MCCKVGAEYGQKLPSNSHWGAGVTGLSQMGKTGARGGWPTRRPGGGLPPGKTGGKKSENGGVLPFCLRTAGDRF